MTRSQKGVSLTATGQEAVAAAGTIARSVESLTDKAKQTADSAPRGLVARAFASEASRALDRVKVVRDFVTEVLLPPQADRGLAQLSPPAFSAAFRFLKPIVA